MFRSAWRLVQRFSRGLVYSGSVEAWSEHLNEPEQPSSSAGAAFSAESRSSPAAAETAGAQRSSAARWAAGTIAVLLLCLLAVWFVRRSQPAAPTRLVKSVPNQGSQGKAAGRGAPGAAQLNDALLNPHGQNTPDGLSGSLLEQIKPGSPGPDDLSGPPATNEQLEKQFSLITETQQKLAEVEMQAARAMMSKSTDTIQEKTEEGQSLVSLLNLRLAALEKDLTAARLARPRDPMVQWLTGELLLIVGGEPEEIEPYLNRAAAAGLKRPQLYVSLARVQFESNRFQEAYQNALKAVEADKQSRTAWEIYMRAAFGIERFGEVVQRLDQSFPNVKPPWAGAIRRSAMDLLNQWRHELALRQAEDRAKNLPMVRLTIEHRVFAGTPDGKNPAQVKTVGRGQVTIELFEDQAPASVANFLTLVEQGFYDGTRFHWSDGGRMVVGGDPNTRNNDPEDDGPGGPGYAIPDESTRPGARGFFRGTLGVVQNGPRTAGSQFFIALVPIPEFNRHFTAFGRVVKGQEVIDQITIGRTNREIGRSGRIIPGDVLVHAEVLRKRSHPYEITKLAPAQ